MIILSIFKEEKGFTLIEVMASLFIMSIVFILILGAYLAGAEKSSYLASEKEIVNSELNLISWIKKDYRENSVLEIEVKESTLDNEKTLSNIVLKLSDGSVIEYKNKSNGYHRLTSIESRKLSNNKVTKVVYDDEINNLKITYRLGNGSKRIVVPLDK